MHVDLKQKRKSFEQSPSPVTHKNFMPKKTGKKKRKLAKALNQMKKRDRKKEQAEVFNYSALHLVNDPQTFCERVFKKLRASKERFEVRLMMMDVMIHVYLRLDGPMSMSIQTALT